MDDRVDPGDAHPPGDDFGDLAAAPAFEESEMGDPHCRRIGAPTQRLAADPQEGAAAFLGQQAVFRTGFFDDGPHGQALPIGERDAVPTPAFFGQRLAAGVDDHAHHDPLQVTHQLPFAAAVKSPPAATVAEEAAVDILHQVFDPFIVRVDPTQAQERPPYRHHEAAVKALDELAPGAIAAAGSAGAEEIG